MLLLFLLLQSANAPAGQQPSRPRGIFSANDYPAEAVRKHWEGTAVADLTIDPQGHVSACQIIQSTGHKVLDDATCDLITKRAMFDPKIGPDGKPTERKFTTPPIAWRLP